MRAIRFGCEFAKKVMGEGADRVDKMKDIAKTIEEGLTQQPSEKGKQQISSLPRYFSASPSPLSPSFAAVSKTPPRKFHHANATDAFKTPEHEHPHHNVNKTPPNLGTRARLPRETQQQRRQRLGFSVAPTMANPVSVVGELFP
jgi:dsDNA-binding SOS-regulon protein